MLWNYLVYLFVFLFIILSVFSFSVQNSWEKELDLLCCIKGHTLGTQTFWKNEWRIRKIQWQWVSRHWAKVKNISPPTVKLEVVLWCIYSYFIRAGPSSNSHKDKRSKRGSLSSVDDLKKSQEEQNPAGSSFHSLYMVVGIKSRFSASNRF